jgi:cytoskeletal protein RodZ
MGPGSSFGQYLQTIRVQKQMSLEQVAAETRIRVTILRALEHEDFAQLPPDVFTVGFVRTYAQAVGADGNEAVERYHAQRRLRLPALAGDPPAASGQRNVSRKLVVALTMLAGLIAACLLIYRLWQEVPLATTADVSSPPAVELAKPPVERMANPPPSTPAAPKHQLTIVARENSWVKVVIDQGAASEHKLKAGDQLRLEAQSGFNLLIGNVGGVRLSLNNQAVTIPGKRGEVVNIHLP